MKNLGDLRYMEIKHAAEKGKGSLHWYTSLDYVVDNIIGMDILRCYDFRMNLDEASANLDHLIEYKPKIDGSAEIKVLQ